MCAKNYEEVLVIADAIRNFLVDLEIDNIVKASIIEAMDDVIDYLEVT